MMAEIHEDFGPLYQFSDHKKGDRLTYRVDGRTEQGEILYVAAASTLPNGRPFPPHYVVIGDGATFPDMVLFGDVVLSPEDEEQEPAMVKCPYCTGHHYVGTVEHCPFNPNRSLS